MPWRNEFDDVADDAVDGADLALDDMHNRPPGAGWNAFAAFGDEAAGSHHAVFRERALAGAARPMPCLARGGLASARHRLRHGHGKKSLKARKALRHPRQPWLRVTGKKSTFSAPIRYATTPGALPRIFRQPWDGPPCHYCRTRATISNVAGGSAAPVRRNPNPRRKKLAEGGLFAHAWRGARQPRPICDEQAGGFCVNLTQLNTDRR